MAMNTEWELLRPFAITFLVGLLIGIEREKSHPQVKMSMGVRSFLLMALLGAWAGWTASPWLSAMTAVFVFGLILVSYLRLGLQNAPEDLGLTTEIAAGLTFVLGYASHQAPGLVTLFGPLVALILFSKRHLHEWSRRMTEGELNAVILLLLIGIGLLPFVPDEPVDPWKLVNPQNFAALVLVLAALEFFSYLALKFLGDRNSSLLVGFLGGLVSSTAVTVSTARDARNEPRSWPRFATTVLVAQVASLCQLLLVVLFLSPPLARAVAIPVGVAMILAAAASFWLISRSDRGAFRIELPSPLDLKGVLKLAAFLGGILIAVGAAQRYLGDAGSQAVSFMSGFFELQGAAFANASALDRERVSLEVAARGTELAVLASFITKVVLGWTLGSRSYARLVTAVMILISAGLFAAAWALGHWTGGAA